MKLILSLLLCRIFTLNNSFWVIVKGFVPASSQRLLAEKTAMQKSSGDQTATRCPLESRSIAGVLGLKRIA